MIVSAVAIGAGAFLVGALLLRFHQQVARQRDDVKAWVVAAVGIAATAIGIGGIVVGFTHHV